MSEAQAPAEPAVHDFTLRKWDVLVLGRWGADGIALAAFGEAKEGDCLVLPGDEIRRVIPDWAGGERLVITGAVGRSSDWAAECGLKMWRGNARPAPNYATQAQGDAAA